MTTIVLAVDPGLTCGFCLLAEGQPPLVFACNAPAAHSLASWLLEANEGPAIVVAAGERFVPGRGAGAHGSEAAVTRQVIADLEPLAPWHWRSAAEVKPWATDRRLEKAGLLAPSAKTVDGRDGCRHAMFCAVHDCGWPDPLSRDGPAFWKRMA